jgi:hypothetical protein
MLQVLSTTPPLSPAATADTSSSVPVAASAPKTPAKCRFWPNCREGATCKFYHPPTEAVVAAAAPSSNANVSLQDAFAQATHVPSRVEPPTVESVAHIDRLAQLEVCLVHFFLRQAFSFCFAIHHQYILCGCVRTYICLAHRPRCKRE